MRWSILMGLVLLGAANGCDKVEKPDKPESSDIRYKADHSLRLDGDLAVYANMDWGKAERFNPCITVVFVNMSNTAGTLDCGDRGASTTFHWSHSEGSGAGDSCGRVWGGPRLKPGECAIYHVLTSSHGVAKTPYLVKVRVDYTWIRADGTKKDGMQRFRFVPPDIETRVDVRD